ncbi:DNA adenine methylase [Lysobacter sp. GCM10012299]|uniref:DNA adenine methylase n=1 Tax=Lysobacter sp. GCM10012299 TaxID=3317333 RepID=UPI00360827AA
MGSKRAMLTNGLGEVLSSEVPKSQRFVDLFTGSGVVAWYAATRWSKPVIASDLQCYAVCLAEAVVARDAPLKDDNIYEHWIDRARVRARENLTYHAADRLQTEIASMGAAVAAGEARLLCESADCSPVQRAYGGYYFSALQALVIDALRATLPDRKDARSVCLAALIQAASRIAAAPGHTAQSFKPNETAGRFLIEAWQKSIGTELRKAYIALAQQCAKTVGSVVQGDAVDVASVLREGDLAFIDPPYSAVHYSRFYHVLETISLGQYVQVEGEGRYPPPELRPKSDFSIKSQSGIALDRLFAQLAKVGAGAVVTFPVHDASNGLSGSSVVGTASKHFTIEEEKISSRMSTMGGNARSRDARLHTEELILKLRPR